MSSEMVAALVGAVAGAIIAGVFAVVSSISRTILEARLREWGAVVCDVDLFRWTLDNHLGSEDESDEQTVYGPGPAKYLGYFVNVSLFNKKYVATGVSDILIEFLRPETQLVAKQSFSKPKFVYSANLPTTLSARDLMTFGSADTYITVDNLDEEQQRALLEHGLARVTVHLATGKHIKRELRLKDYYVDSDRLFKSAS